ncbi:MAG: type II toxin-antitoxin system RelB/DinJ family antitoxin [Clostridiales Family XIII bacterium]|jgi:addiction module RelB/DinJ family antitoxin|nr:type II toxin-antitoxin system RelB/DinJ family antitoxin [Clostridiales Family XIII bacterium]
MSEARLSIRVDAETKAQADRVFRKIGLTMSSGVAIYLAKVAAEQAIPFALTLNREEEIGKDAYAFEQAAALAARDSIQRMQYEASPVARYDDEKKQPYLEYADGRREYAPED